MSDDERPIVATQNSGFCSDGDQYQSITIIENYHGPTFEKLVAAHDTQLTFNPRHLEEIIITIEKGIKQIDDNPLDFSTKIDIEKKNTINNHSQDYFEQIVEVDFYPQFHRIDEFLSLRANQKTIQPKIDRIIKSLNRKILAFQGEHRFEAILLKIADQLIEANHEALEEIEHEVLLVLYYFYTTCCIGKKTNDE